MGNQILNIKFKDNMCKKSYKQMSERTGKIMIFCSLIGNDGTLNQLCISQRFCKEKDCYVPLNQKENCKKYEE